MNSAKFCQKLFFLIFESLEMIDFDRETCDRANFFGEDLPRAFAARLGGAGDVPTGALRARALRALRARFSSNFLQSKKLQTLVKSMLKSK